MTSVASTSDATFADEVVARSHQQPVLVDFWAAWCGPCRVLSPVLERLAPEVADRVSIVKLDTEANPATAARYAIRSIPAVKLFKAGVVAAEFVGALPEGQILAFIDEHCPSPRDQQAAAARAALQADDVTGAGRLAALVLAEAPDHQEALVVAARAALASGDRAAARVHAERVSAYVAQADEARAVLELLALAEAGAAGVDATAATAAAASSAATHFAHGAALAAAAAWRPALDAMLASVEADRRWNDQAARKAMLTVFHLVGPRSTLADEYRRRLAILL